MISVSGFCPMGCGETLRLRDNKVACVNDACGRPSAASEILSESETKHIVTIDRDSFSVKHPLWERLDNGLLDCALGIEVADNGWGWGVDPGVPYRMWWAADGEDVEWERL